MIAYVMLIVTMANGQVQDYKPASENLFQYQSECQQAIPGFLMNNPQLRRDDIQIVCADVNRP